MQTNIVASAGASGVIIAVPKATALIYGSVLDNSGNPFRALDVYANDTVSNLYQTDGYTDTNGNYVLGVLGWGANDSWWMEANSGNQLTNYVFSQSQLPNNGAIAAGTAVQQNFTGILATNLVTGNVKTSNGNPIAGLSVWGNAIINDTNYQSNYTLTDNNGNYLFNVCNGSWTIGVNCQGGDDSLDGTLGSGNYVCPGNQNAIIASNNSTNNFTIQLCGGVSILTTSLPAGGVGVYYDQFLSAASCNNNFTWSVISGSPSDLTLDAPSGMLYGTPNAGGTFNFTVHVTDGGGHSTNQALALVISNAVQITTPSLPNGTNGSAYSLQFQASGGVPFGGGTPYIWSSLSGLPPNLMLAADGLLSGNAATSGTFDITVQAMDSLGGVASTNFSLVLIATNSPALAIASAGGQSLIFWPASFGTNYTLEMTTNLATGPWMPVTDGVPQAAFVVSNRAPNVFFRLQ